MSFLKIGGRTDSDTSVGVSVSDEGAVRTEKCWKVTYTTLCNQTVPKSGDADETLTAFDTAATELDVSGAAFVSIHLLNYAKIPIKVNLLYDLVSSDSDKSNLSGADGNPIELSIPYAGRTIITTDDWPVLGYIKFLRLKITPLELAASAVSSPVIKIIACTKE